MNLSSAPARLPRRARAGTSKSSLQTCQSFPPPSATAPATRHEAELEDMLARGRKVQIVDSVIWSVAMIALFLGLFVFDWSYFWISPVIAFFASWAARGVLKFSESDEELFDELTEGEEKKRAERLRAAAERRRELEA